jgi:hypothetical protein
MIKVLRGGHWDGLFAGSRPRHIRWAEGEGDQERASRHALLCSESSFVQAIVTGKGTLENLIDSWLIPMPPTSLPATRLQCSHSFVLGMRTCKIERQSSVVVCTLHIWFEAHRCKGLYWSKRCQKQEQGEVAECGAWCAGAWTDPGQWQQAERVHDQHIRQCFHAMPTNRY